MSSEIHVVVASDRTEALARLQVLADGRNPEIILAGPRSRVSFEDLSRPDSGYDREEDGLQLFCVVARIDD